MFYVYSITLAVYNYDFRILNKQEGRRYMYNQHIAKMMSV